MTKPVQEKPTSHEDEYFHRQDSDLLQQMRQRLDAARSNAERFSHFMKCPKCGADLAERKFESVMIDVCPECKGVWLDAGELDMIRHLTERNRAHAGVTSGVRVFLDDLIDFFWHHRTPAPKQ